MIMFQEDKMTIGVAFGSLLFRPVCVSVLPVGKVRRRLVLVERFKVHYLETILNC